MRALVLKRLRAFYRRIRQVGLTAAGNPENQDRGLVLQDGSAEIFGASVGDSGAWLIPQNGTHLDLTQGQQRKPFIGSGSAWSVPFRHQMQGGSLLLATDGLLKYASAERIIETCRQHPTGSAAQRLIELVRCPSGALPDDVTLILTVL